TPITAQNGRYGPYLKKGTDTRTLPSEESIFTIDLAGAQELFAQPKYGGRRAASALKELGTDPTSEKPITLRTGRFGPYVTDGETNASVPRGEDPDSVTHERAVELISIRRAKGPAKRRTRKTTAKKAAPKKAVDPKRSAAAKKAAATRKRNA